MSNQSVSIQRVYHSLFDYQLSANALKVYVFLTTCQNALGTATVRIGVIAARCGISSPTTVQAALGELQEKGLVRKFRRKLQDGQYISNGYDITQLSGAWFLFPTDAAVLTLPKASFAAYLYLHKCVKNTKGSTRRVHPSYQRMADVLHMARNTIIAAIADLVSRFLLWKAQQWHGKHNMYVLHKLADIIAQKGKSSADGTPHCSKHRTETRLNSYPSIIVAIKGWLVKGFNKIAEITGQVVQKMTTYILNQQEQL